MLWTLFGRIGFREERCRRSWPWRAIALLLLILVVSGSLAPAALARTTPTETAVPLSTAPSIQSYLDRVMQKVTEFRLDNGLKFIVLERHQAPVVSFLTYANVGGVDEPDGQTGVAHFLEHLAFKGTTRIGTLDYDQEAPLLNRLDELSTKLTAGTSPGKTPATAAGTATEAQLKAEFAQVEAAAAKLVKQNELGRIVQQSGGVGLNANTSTEATRYFYSFPSNKLELWMSLESDRFLDPVFREFYKEKDVILEERRMRTDNSPIGQMIEAFLDTAFTVHPYRRPVIGYDQDIRNLTRQDVQTFFDTHYVPANLTIAIVGDVDPTTVKRLAQVYFGRFKARPLTAQQIAPEPPQTAPRSVTLKLASQPWYLEGYHRPAVNHPDNVVYELMADILSEGRTSRLYQSLVERQPLALQASGFSGFPGDKYPNLMLFYALTAPGHTVDEVAQALHQEIERLQTEPVSATELSRVKTQARASLLRSLDSNMGLAQLLTEYEVKTGDWRNLFTELDKIIAVTPDDILRVARATFAPANRTVGKILPL
jgi:predicted Zn-dependent peptidase